MSLYPILVTRITRAFVLHTNPYPSTFRGEADTGAGVYHDLLSLVPASPLNLHCTADIVPPSGETDPETVTAGRGHAIICGRSSSIPATHPPAGVVCSIPPPPPPSPAVSSCPPFSCPASPRRCHCRWTGAEGYCRPPYFDFDYDYGRPIGVVVVVVVVAVTISLLPTSPPQLALLCTVYIFPASREKGGGQDDSGAGMCHPSAGEDPPPLCLLIQPREILQFALGVPLILID